MSSIPELHTLLFSYPSPNVAQVTINRPSKSNAMTTQMYHEIRSIFTYLDLDSDTRCIVLSGNSESFCLGTDQSEFTSLIAPDAARGALKVQKKLKDLQDCITTVENCRKPVVVAISGYCVGVGFDLITACCIRLCSKNSIFSVKEIISDMPAGMGALQRLPKIVGNQAWVKEIVYSGKDFNAEEAAKEGLVSEVFENFDSTLNGALKLANEIAEKSPIAVVGSKVNCNYAMNHSVKDSLDFIVRWNGWAFQTADMDDSVAAQKEKKKIVYPKL